MKMKNNAYIRSISAVLLGSMLVSCGSGTVSDDSGTSAETSSDFVSEETKKAFFEMEDYGGVEFNIHAPDWGLYSNYFNSDEQTGDSMDDALYERNKKVEEYLGVKISFEATGAIEEILKKVQQAVMSQDDSYQLVLTHCISSVYEMVTTDLLYDWKDLKYCNFEADYWNHSSMNDLEVNGHSFYAVSDYMLPDPNVILFNKGLIDQFSLENPYDIVRSGKWTIDKLIQMASSVTGDLNGDNKMDAEDRYGFASESDWLWNSFLYSSQLHMVTRDGNGGYKLDLDKNKMLTLVEKLDTLINKSGDAYIYNGNVSEENKLPISKGRSLFEITSINRMRTLRETDVEYGIIPYPKFDEAQDDYYNNDWSGLMCIPKTVNDPDMVGKVCEMLAYYSGETARPAYFNLLLGEKLARDEDSKEMLDLVFKNIVFDPGMNYFGFQSNMMNLFYTFHKLVINEKKSDYASWDAKYRGGAEAEIEKFNKAISELE